MAAPCEQRNPRDNLLYQLIETHFDTFEEVYDEAFSQDYGFGWGTGVLECWNSGRTDGRPIAAGRFR